MSIYILKKSSEFAFLRSLKMRKEKNGNHQIQINSKFKNIIKITEMRKLHKLNYFC